MNREEIRQQAEEYRQPYRDGGYHLSSKDIKEAFEEGAKWADKTMIDKACEWLEKGGYFVNSNETINDFRKAMEE